LVPAINTKNFVVGSPFAILQGGHAIALDEKAEKYLPKMVTDISIERENSKAIIDTKYYKEALVTYYGKEKIRSGNLFQLHAYLSNLEHKGGINLNCPGVLLYPTVDAEYCLPYQFGKHRVTVCTINLNRDWNKIHEDLMTILDGALTPSINYACASHEISGLGRGFFTQQLVNKLQKISFQFIGIIVATFYSEFNLTF
jgi:hypothetical protein